MAKAKPIPDLTAEVPYAEAAAKIVSVRGSELAEEAQGVLDTGDIERVHDMRVATRRLRAALEIFEPCFPEKAYSQALTEVKRLADALGERRDRDVAIAALHSFNDQMAAPDGPHCVTPCGFFLIGLGSSGIVYDFQICLPLPASSDTTLPRNLQHS